MLKATRSDARVTIADVAREAGVSRQTVSRVINDKGEISPETLQHVRAVIARLGYRPSSIARSLATHKTHTIGLIVPDIANPFFAEIARGAEDAVHAAGYGLLLCNTVEDPLREADALLMLEDKRVDGVVLCSSRLPGEQLSELAGHHPAAVLINRTLPGSQVRSVCVQDQEGTEQAMRHLFVAGRRVIGFLSGPSTSSSAMARARGYSAALAAAGCAPDPELQITSAPYIAGGCESAIRLLAARPDVDAIFCHNDLVAVGALQACALSGRQVPQDIAIVGCDDILLAGLVTPALTTLRVDKRKIGATAMELLLLRIGGCMDGDCGDVTFCPELIVRASAP